MRRLPQSTAARVVMKVYLSSDHVSSATGKTVAITLSKAGGAFANPSAGATNATEIANGWYYVDLSTTDTGTTGALIVRGTSAACDDAERPYHVVNANTGELGNLDVALSTIAAYVDTEVAAIKAKTDQLSFPLSISARGAYQSEVTDDAPILYARFTEASGAPVADLSGNARTGTATAGYTRGMAGAIAADNDAALALDGTGYVSYGDVAWVDFGAGDFTFEFWIKPNALPSGSRYLLIGKDAASQRQFGLCTNSGGGAGTAGDLQLFLYSDAAGSSLWTGTTAAGVLAAGVWQHVAAQRSGALLLIYVNGVSKLVTASGGPFNMPATASDFRIGARSYASFEEPFPGLVDEVAVYNSALSAARILRHYQAGVGGVGPVMLASQAGLLTLNDIPTTVPDAIRAASIEFTDYLLTGDSEVLHSGGGIDEAISYAMSQLGYRMYATPMLSGREGNGGGNGQGYLCDTSANSEGAGTGAPSELAAYLDKGSGAYSPAEYYFGDIGINGFARISIDPACPINISGNLLFEIYYGEFPSGTHNFWPLIHLQSPFAALYAAPAAINATTGRYAISRYELAAPAAARTREMNFRANFLGSAGVTGVFIPWWRVINTDFKSGFSVHAEDYRGGQPLRVVAYDMQQASDTTLSYKWSQIRRRQGTRKHMVFVYSGGQNDLNDSTLSMGPNPAPGNTAVGRKDNLTAWEAAIRRIFTLNGWPQSEVSLIVAATHPMDDPWETWLVTVRAADKEWCSQRPNAFALDFSLFTSMADLSSRGYYFADGSKAHLTQDGYRYLWQWGISYILNPPDTATTPVNETVELTNTSVTD